MKSKFKVKFFGSKEIKKQIALQKLEVEAETAEQVEDILRHVYKFKVINGLKISKVAILLTMLILNSCFAEPDCQYESCPYYHKSKTDIPERIKVTKTNIPECPNVQVIEKVNLNDFLGNENDGIDWNRTEINNFQDSILTSNGISYDTVNKSWIKKNLINKYYSK